jgi:hypothetical protein
MAVSDSMSAALCGASRAAWPRARVASMARPSRSNSSAAPDLDK